MDYWRGTTTATLTLKNPSLDIMLDALDIAIEALHERHRRAPSPASAHAVEALSDLADELYHSRPTHR